MTPDMPPDGFDDLYEIIRLLFRAGAVLWCIGCLTSIAFDLDAIRRHLTGQGPKP